MTCKTDDDTEQERVKGENINNWSEQPFFMLLGAAFFLLFVCLFVAFFFNGGRMFNISYNKGSSFFFFF